jgi:hypothetical protein
LGGEFIAPPGTAPNRKEAGAVIIFSDMRELPMLVQ